jgi:hypothetical protein
MDRTPREPDHDRTFPPLKGKEELERRTVDAV